MQTAFTWLFHRSRSGPNPKWGSFFSYSQGLSIPGGGKKIKVGANLRIDDCLKLQGGSSLLNKNIVNFEKS